MARIHVVEDDAALASGLAYNLEREGHQVVISRDGSAGLSRALTERPDLVVLDLMLPGLDGFTFLERFHALSAGTPVIVLSALADEATKIRGLRSGAIDYVSKPFGVGELLARIGLRLAESSACPRVIRIGDGELDLDRFEFRCGGSRVSITPTEASLVSALARRVGVAVTRDELLRGVWGVESASTRTLDTHVARLRRKLEPDPAQPRHLVTVHGVGFRLDV